MDITKIESLVKDKIKEFCAENNIELDSLNSDTRLIGSSGIFDSMDLVNFIVELEESIEDEMDIEVSLADEKAMSRRTSPFVNVTSLSKFILEQKEESE